MRFIFISFSLFFAQPFFAQTEINTHVSEATLYPNGSKITRQAQVEIPAGNSIFKFHNLYAYIDANSIQINIDNPAIRMVDFNFSVNYLNPPKTAEEIIKVTLDTKELGNLWMVP